ncbi:MAG: hypothetical protein U1D67_01330 [Dehalococcoidia bacterium]|nr:hypothetical protein [Dehalococcoidia bacterium]
MATKTTTWTDALHATVTIHDGPAAGEYPIGFFDLDQNSGQVRLGKITVNGKETRIISKASEIDGLMEHYNAYVENMKNQPRHCERCGVEVSKDAYHQQEWTRFGGRAVKVSAYYCDSCHGLLRSIGAGEIPSYEPAGKEDY